MLSKTFLSAEELGIDADIYDALVQVYWMLVDETIPEELFAMNQIGCPNLSDKGHPCGTPGCILGWCNAVHGKLYHQSYQSMAGRLASLFYAGDFVYLFGKRRHAAVAVHNYLTTGKPNWKEAMQA